MNVLLTYKKYFKPIGLFLAVVLFFIVFKFLNQGVNQEKLDDSKMDEFDIFSEQFNATEDTNAKLSAEEVMIVPDVLVDVKGAVINPNVYKLEEGSRVLDAITLAGGLSPDADQAKINLALRVQDEMVIYVPIIGEDIEVESITSMTQANDSGGKININTASVVELQSLPGIGPSKAASIVAYRDEVGRFQKVEDLGNVSGIGEKSLEKLIDHITIR